MWHWPIWRGQRVARARAELDAQYAGRCLFVAVDVTSTEQVDQMMAATVKALGSLDGVFNNAGIGGLSPADTYPDEEFLRIVDINLTGVFRVARASLHQMYSQGSGSLVNCASILGVFGQSMTAAYSAAKGGVVNLTRTLALESAGQGRSRQCGGAGLHRHALAVAAGRCHPPGPDPDAPHRAAGPRRRGGQRRAVFAQRRSQLRDRLPTCWWTVASPPASPEGGAGSALRARSASATASRLWRSSSGPRSTVVSWPSRTTTRPLTTV